MALVEIDRSTPPSSFRRELASLPQIPEIYPFDIKDFASKYWSNKKLIEGMDHETMTGIQTKILGIMEIQKEFLCMLGQEHLLEEDPRNNFRVYQIKQITPQEISSMINRYRNLRKIYEERDLERLIWTTLQATPDEVRMEGNMDELRFILFRLGQEQTVMKIDADAEQNKENFPLAA